jgi:hypothetical protein
MVEVTKDGRTDHRHCRNIEIGRPIFDQKYNFSVQIKKSEHASGLCSDMKPFVRGQVDGHVSKDLNRLEIEISKVNGTMEQPVQSTNI